MAAGLDEAHHGSLVYDFWGAFHVTLEFFLPGFPEVGNFYYFCKANQTDA